MERMTAVLLLGAVFMAGTSAVMLGQMHEWLLAVVSAGFPLAAWREASRCSGAGEHQAAQAIATWVFAATLLTALLVDLLRFG